jgi:hypothetical protein
MKESALSNKVLQKLKEFETIENLQPSADWTQSLMNKLDSAKPYPTSGFSATKFTVVLLFIILVNIGFILNAMIRDSHQSLYRDKELLVISNELLINPISINN